jgi:hypothetical protein
LKHLKDFVFLFVNLSFYRSVSKVQTCQSPQLHRLKREVSKSLNCFCVCVCICFVSLTKGDISEALTTQGSCVKVQSLLRFTFPFVLGEGVGAGGVSPPKTRELELMTVSLCALNKP